MPYELTSSDPHKIIFERRGTGFSRIFVGLIGSVFLLIGIGFILLSTGYEYPFVLFKIFFPLMGGGALVIAIIGPQQNKAHPEIIMFDHTKAAVVIEMKKGGMQKGYIRYNEIEKFDTYIERVNNSSSSSSSRSYSTYFFHVLLRKKDGGEWFLTRSNTQETADELVRRLSQEVQTEKPSSFLPSPTLTEKILKEEKMDKTFVYWQNKVGILAPIILVVFSAVFLGILSTAFTAIGGLGIFGGIVIGFILLVFLIVMYFSVRTMIKNATTKFAVAVGKNDLSYLEISKSTGITKSTRSIPIKDVYSISYSFCPVKQYAASGLSILTKEQHLQALYDRTHPVEALKNFFKGQNKMINLSIIALNPVECLQLESWLQELVKKKGGGDVL